MNRDQFWLTDTQFSKIEPHLPTDTRGKPRVDDVRVISGIVHRLWVVDRHLNPIRTDGCLINRPPAKEGDLSSSNNLGAICGAGSGMMPGSPRHHYEPLTLAI